MKPIIKKIHLIHLIITLTICNTTSLLTSTPIFCGKIQIQPPFLIRKNQQHQPPPPSENHTERSLSRMFLCKSHKLYFRTSLGLFPVSSIDYNTKLITIISHPFLSSTQNFISPSLLSTGFPYPPQPNSLILVNCSLIPSNFFVIHDCDIKDSSCLLVEDSEKLEVGFNPLDLNCSHYVRVYKKSASYDGYEVGTRISFEMMIDHVPNICSECDKPQGDCGVGLRCICHARECKDKIVNKGGFLNPVGSIILTTVTCVLVALTYYGLLI